MQSERVGTLGRLRGALESVTVSLRIIRDALVMYQEEVRREREGDGSGA
jgi:hypothetical protein